jgi:hypothetical protein
MTKLIENAQVVSPAFTPVSFIEFAKEAEKRGFTQSGSTTSCGTNQFTPWSSSQFILKTANGMRCEFMNSRGGKLGFGYTCSPRKVKALYEHFLANPGSNPVIDHYVTHSNALASNERRTMFTLKATDLQSFFDIVDFIAKFEFPVVTVAPKATAVSKPVVKVAPKAEVKAIERAKTVEEMADIAAAASARFAKKTGKAF